MRFGMRLVTIKRLLKSLATGKLKVPDAPAAEEFPNVVESMQLLHLGDLWAEARMEEVLVYLRGNRSLQIP